MKEFSGPLHEAKPDDDQDKKKGRKKSTNLRLPSFAAVETDSKQAKPEKSATPEPSVLDKALAELAVRRREKAENGTETGKAKEARKPGKVEHESGPVAIESNTAAAESKATADAGDYKTDSKTETRSETDTDEEEKTYEPLPGYDPEPVEFSGGEVIIHLQGDEPVAERVIPSPAEVPLQAERAAEIPLETPQEAPVLTPQPEQQHQAHSQESAPEPQAAGGGEVPPIKPPEAFTASAEQPPEPPRPAISGEVLEPSRQEPAEAYREYVRRQAEAQQAIAPGSEKVATKQDVEDAIYYATKAGQSRGVLTGLIVGGGYEHFKHKRRERKAEKRYKAQTKQLEAARQSYTFGLQEQAKQQSETERRFATAEQRFHQTEKRYETQAHAERARVPLPNPEQTNADGSERLDIPPEHRLETSAWHTIEIDAKTGKPVENPTFQYGHEYYRERAQEATPVAQRNAAAGEVALVAAAAASQRNGSAPSDDTSLPQVQIPNATTQGPPPSPQRQPSDGAGQQKATDSSDTSKTRLWPWLLALVVIVICLIVVTR